MNRMLSPLALPLCLLLSCLLPVSVLATDKTIELERDGEHLISIPLDGSVPVNIDGSTGSLRATTTSEFTCADEPDPIASCDDVFVSMAGSNGNFGANRSSVTRGGSVTLNWSSRGAWLCEGTGLPGTNWASGTKLPAGSQSVALDLEPGNYQAGIRCSNGEANIAERGPISISVTEPDVAIPPECAGRQPGGMQRTLVCRAGSSTPDCDQYESVYGEFPGNQQGRQIKADRNEYIALEFTVGSDVPTHREGTLSFGLPQVPPSYHGRKMTSISRCPGDFDRDAIEQEMGSHCYRKEASLVGPVNWMIAGGTSSSRCVLERGVTYYYNIVYTDSPAGTPPADINWKCGSYSPEVNVCSNNTVPVF